jgi:hypothetical protein
MAAVNAEGLLKLSVLLAERKARTFGDGDLS